MSRTRITGVKGRQILDSRGRPTVEVDVTLADGSLGRASVPSGASTGRHEAAELRDGDPESYRGLGVLKAVSNVEGAIARRIAGLDATEQDGVDDAMLSLDPSPRLQTIGANAVLATSLAVARAAARATGQPLYAYLHHLLGARPMSMPMPMTNILSGGAHAGRSMDVQDFLVMPVGARSYREALAMISRVRLEAANLMAAGGLSVLLADEGGLSPGYRSVREALDLMVRSFEAAGLRPGEDVAITLDIAASELAVDGAYVLAGAGQTLSREEMVGLLGDMVARYPIVSIEDPLEQDDWAGWQMAQTQLAGIQLVGDDLFVTSTDRIARGIELGAANAVLIKLNQNGTLSRTLAAMRTAWQGGMATIVSARSGETEDSFIADLAVGSGAGQIKIGSVRNSERLAKYNQLTRIEEEAEFAFAGISGVAVMGARSGDTLAA
jgi:enolase